MQNDYFNLVLALLHHVVDFCYPPVCGLCGIAATTSPLCDDCTADLERLKRAAACERCGYPLVAKDDPCPHCRGNGISPIDRVSRLGVFSDPLRILVHRIKYRHGWTTAEFLADQLAAHEPALAILRDADCIVPVPLHPLKQWSRGYNQATVIANRLAKISGKRLCSPLVRLRNTGSQTAIKSQEGRLKNVRDAFGLLDSKSVRGQRIVLVDDVITSGSTIRSAARALAAAGPVNINVIAVASADPKGRAYEFV